jgi:hypothetical protein
MWFRLASPILLLLPVEFLPVKNAGHDFAQAADSPISPSLETIHDRTIAFFNHYLLNPQEPDQAAKIAPRSHTSSTGTPACAA